MDDSLVCGKKENKMEKMIKPNFDLMLYILLLLWTIKAILQILMGCLKNGQKKEEIYDITDVLAGLISLGIIAIIFLF